MYEISSLTDKYFAGDNRQSVTVPEPLTVSGNKPRILKKRGYRLEMVATMPARASCGMYTGSYIACTLADYGAIYHEKEQKHSGKMVKATCNSATCEVCGQSHDWEHPGVVEKKAIELAAMLDGTYKEYRKHGAVLDFYNSRSHKFEKYVEFIISPPGCEYQKYDRITGYNSMQKQAWRYAELCGLVGGVRVAVHAVRDGDGKKNKVMEQYRRGEVELPEDYHNHFIGFFPHIRVKSDDFNLLTSRGIMAIYGAELLREFASYTRKKQKDKIAELEKLHPELCAEKCENRKTGWVYKTVPQSKWSKDKKELKKKIAYELDHAFVPARKIISERRRRNQIVYEGQEPDVIEYEINQHGHLYDPVGVCHQSAIKREEAPVVDEAGNVKYKKCRCEGCTEYQYMHGHDLFTPFDQPGERGDPVVERELVIELRPGAFERMAERYDLTIEHEISLSGGSQHV